MSTLIKITAALFLTALSCSCNIAFDGIRGEGEVIRKEKTINENFETIKSSRGLDVVLTNKKDRKVIIEANENLHQYIEVYVEGETLYITADKNIYQADEKTVYVSYNKLGKISATSGSRVTSQGAVVQKDLAISATSGANIKLKVKAESLTTSVTSGAIMNLSGKVNNHKANATSGANIRADELLSLVSVAKATSGSHIKIHAKDQFTGKATSGADVVYYGDPQKVSEDDNSGGNVRRN
ncbi:head GIN domain-containing protein [uncultured Aquimarina sp.]|uniref:head GIN domain-containing protein n=1 Tax=uncultured Aquimarina sp. TaxID=575652 RepID=UPI0026080084|nr:head GIN domain-containing protein [uncultured Aquimarina sp.]